MNLNNQLGELDKVLYRRRTACAVCKKELSNPLIELRELPLTEIFIETKPDKKRGFVDQYFHLCDHCGHAQLSSIVDPKILYGFSYSFKTTNSVASMNGNDVYLDFIRGIIKERHFKSIIEIGCNDAYLLNLLREKGERLIGVDPTLKGKEGKFADSKISVIGDYFENIDIKKLFSPDGSLILSSHNLEHIEDPRFVIKTLLDTSSERDVCIFQFPGLETLVEDCRFDQIFSHHYHYFSLRSFEYLVNDLGGEVIAFDVNRPHWGSLLVAFKKGS
ncbi:methyltransferase domain-containing protein, partial [Candidatus Peregrinibacteria bacterium]|nr:methyltransferase domain-containing protein [Candidatus Peregrinibacteria bacterium]